MRSLALVISLVSLSAAGLFPSHALASWKHSFIGALKNGGAYVESDKGGVLLDHRSTEHFIPASTMKLATAACTINELGIDYRFPTDFSITAENKLVVRGYGDPFLVSEELDLIAKALTSKGLKKISGLILDASFFETHTVDGQSRSSNPYDAINGALVANFNTVFFRKNGKTIESAEPQTPMTPIARELSRKYGNGKHRVNLGKDPQKSARYFGELLIAFLRQNGAIIEVNKGELPIKLDKSPSHAKLIYRHRSSKTLSEVIKGLLKYSTNFMANQLFLAIGAKQHGAPASNDKGQRALSKCLQEHVGWSDFTVLEGAGLSRKNSITPRQLMTLLKLFEPYRKLLPIEKNRFQAKTGTLTGVNTYAGYFDHEDGRLIRFVIMVNSAVPYDYKFRLAQQLYRGVHTSSKK